MSKAYVILFGIVAFYFAAPASAQTVCTITPDVVIETTTTTTTEVPTTTTTQPIPLRQVATVPPFVSTSTPETTTTTTIVVTTTVKKEEEKNYFKKDSFKPVGLISRGLRKGVTPIQQRIAVTTATLALLPSPISGGLIKKRK